MLRLRYAAARDGSRKSTWFDDGESPEAAPPDAHDVVLDAGERTLMKAVDRGEWTTVDGFRAAKARHTGSATATLRRLRKE